MSQASPYAEALRGSVAQASVETRAAFLTRTYAYLLGSIVAFTLIEVGLFTSGIAVPMANAMLSTNWLLVLGAFMLVAWLASAAAQRATSPAVQHLALAGYVVAEALIFVPMLVIANLQFPGVITSAATVTILGFAGLTGIVFLTRKDFSFMRGLMFWGGICVLVLIVASVLFGFALGTWFSVAMIAFAGAAILYKTSNVLLHYPADRHVSAALELFASVALLFWYVLRLFMGRRR